MAVADIAKTVARIIWTIGARNDGGAFDNSVSDDRFIQEEIIRAAVETEAEIVRALCEGNQPARIPFMAWSASLNNGDNLPVHIGEVEAVEITTGSGTVIGEATTRDNIKAWRLNHNSRYGSLAHTAAGAITAGYFNITNQTIVFTGVSAKVKICTFTPNYTAHQITNDFESGIIAGAIPKLNKTGVPPSLVTHYENQYSNWLSAIRNGHKSLPPIQQLHIAQD
jgi:hypothetical protein